MDLEAIEEIKCMGSALRRFLIDEELAGDGPEKQRVSLRHEYLKKRRQQVERSVHTSTSSGGTELATKRQRDSCQKKKTGTKDDCLRG